jgi:hypothetical protein
VQIYVELEQPFHIRRGGLLGSGAEHQAGLNLIRMASKVGVDILESLYVQTFVTSLLESVMMGLQWMVRTTGHEIVVWGWSHNR